MSDTMTDIEATSLRDQVDAHWRDVSAATARHYAMLVKLAEMDPEHAAELARDFQAMLLEPMDPEVNVYVGGEE